MNKLFLAGVLIGGAVLIASCVHRSSNESPLIVNVKRNGEDCHITVEGEQVTSDRLFQIGRSDWKRRAIIIYAKDAPFKCTSGAIFTLQRSGLVSVEAMMWDGS